MFHEATNTHKKHVLISKNGDIENSKGLYLEPCWSFFDFLKAASSRLNVAPIAQRAFTVDGGEINDCMMIDDDDLIVISDGSPFIMRSDDDATNKVVGVYKVDKLLGRGSFGVVKLGINMLNNQKIALKFLKKSKMQSIGSVNRVTNELQCLSVLKHKNIIKLHSRIETPDHIVLALDLMEGGDLLQYMTSSSSSSGPSSAVTKLSECDARTVFKQIIDAVSYMHQQGVIHRDLKLDNIMIANRQDFSVIRIVDFGLSEFSKPGSTLRSPQGTLSYLAPEVFGDTSYAGQSVDMWAVGVILFAMLCGRLPFSGPSLKPNDMLSDGDIISNIKQCRYQPNKHLTTDVKVLLLSLLTLNPVRRAIAPQIIISRWYTSTSSSISSSGSGSGSGKVPSDYDLEIPPDSVSGSVASECGSVEKSPGPHSTKGTMSPGTIDAEVAGDENGQKSLLSCSNSSQSLYSLASSVVTPPRTSMTPEEVLGRFTVVRGQVSHANSSLSNLFDRSWSEASKRGHVDRQHSDKKPNYQQPTQSWEVNERYRDCRYLLSRGSSERGVTGTPAAFEQNISSGNLVEKGVGGLEGQSPWRSGRGERVGPSVDGRRVSCDWSLSVSSCMEDSISHLLVEQRASPLQVPAVPVAVTAMEVKPLLARRASMSQFNSSSAEKDAVCSPLIDELDKTLMSKERDSPVVQKVKFPLPTAGTSPGVSPVAWPAMFDASGGGGGNQESLLDQVDMTILISPTRTAYSSNKSAQIENTLISSDEVVTRTSFGFRPKAKTMSPLPTERKSTIAIDSSRDTLSRVNKSGSTRFHVSSSSTRTTQRLLLRQNSSDF